MAKLKVFGKHKFVTQGIWLQRGSKKTLLTGKKAVDYLPLHSRMKILEDNLNEIHNK